MVICEIVTGPNWTPLISAYLRPLTLEHIPDIEEALQRFKVWDTIVLGDLNVDLNDARSSQSQRVANLLTDFGLINLIQHYR